CRRAAFVVEVMAEFAPSMPLGHVNLMSLNVVPRQVLDLAETVDLVVCDGPGGLGEVTRTLLVSCPTSRPADRGVVHQCRVARRSAGPARLCEDIHPATPPVATVVLNKVRRRARLARDARDALRPLGIGALHATLRDLDAFKIAPQERTAVWHMG